MLSGLNDYMLADDPDILDLPSALKRTNLNLLADFSMSLKDDCLLNTQKDLQVLPAVLDSAIKCAACKTTRQELAASHEREQGLKQ